MHHVSFKLGPSTLPEQVLLLPVRGLDGVLGGVCSSHKAKFRRTQRPCKSLARIEKDEVPVGLGE